MISHNEGARGALARNSGTSRRTRHHKGHLAVALDRFEDSAKPLSFGSRPGSSMGKPPRTTWQRRAAEQQQRERRGGSGGKRRSTAGRRET